MGVPLSGDLCTSLGDKFEALDAVLDEVDALSIKATVNALVLGLGLHGPKLDVVT